MQNNPTTASLPPQFEHFASVASSTPASLDQAANPRRSPGMEGAIDNCPPETRAQLEARESMAKPGIEAMEREAMVRKKRIIEAGGREEKSPRKEEDSPGVTEEVLYMNQPNPPLANKMQKMPQQKVQTDDATVWFEKQIQFGATVGGKLTEISLADDGGEFDVFFKKDAMILLRSPGATENSEAPQPSKKP